MIRLSDAVWIGVDADVGVAVASGAGGLLNVAHDLRARIGWPDVEYMQCGLVDGPGNEVVDYCAALLGMITLLRRHPCVLVYDHGGGRALAVAIMHAALTKSRRAAGGQTFLSCRQDWATLLDAFNRRAGGVLVAPHSAHAEAFGQMPFGLLEAML